MDTERMGGSPEAGTPGTKTELEYLARQTELLEEQAALQRKTCRFALIAAICCVILLVIAAAAAWKVIPEMQRIRGSLETTASSLESMAEQLEQARVSEAVNRMLDMMDEVEENIALANENLNELDLEKLNESIRKLSDMLAPIAKLFGGGTS